MDTKSWLDWFILGLAVYTAMVAWFDGSIFALPRGYCEAWASSENNLVWFIGEALSCPICLPTYIAFAFFMLSLIPGGRAILFIYAAGGLASISYRFTKLFIVTLNVR